MNGKNKKNSGKSRFEERKRLHPGVFKPEIYRTIN
jgi:hypothetical protein